MEIKDRKINSKEQANISDQIKPLKVELKQFLTIAIPSSMHYEIKKFALERKMTLKDLFLDMYAFYKDNK
jgi:hypothetical protein